MPTKNGPIMKRRTPRSVIARSPALRPRPQRPEEERAGRALPRPQETVVFPDEVDQSALDEEAAAAAAEAEDDSQAPDGALGLYLRQMGAIPLLSRQEELALATRLEQVRTRYRHAVLLNWSILQRV